MALDKEQKLEIFKSFGGKETNTGSAEAQIALITKRIDQLTEHFQTHKKDFNSRRGLLSLVGQRKKLLSYLKKHDINRYRTIVDKLGLRK